MPRPDPLNKRSVTPSSASVIATAPNPAATPTAAARRNGTTLDGSRMCANGRNGAASRSDDRSKILMSVQRSSVPSYGGGDWRSTATAPRGSRIGDYGSRDSTDLRHVLARCPACAGTGARVPWLEGTDCAGCEGWNGRPKRCPECRPFRLAWCERGIECGASRREIGLSGKAAEERER